MIVTTQAIEATVALFEQPHCDGILRVLIFREGTLPATVILLLGKLLAHL